MDEEILACIKENHVKYLQAGQISKYIFPVERKKAHENNICHLIIRIFILAITPDKKTLFLVQKRSKNKRVFPEYFTDSVSGHVTYERNLELEGIKQNALRELSEEFGIQSDDVKEIVFKNLLVEHDGQTKEIAYIFHALVKHDVKLNPDPLELEIKGSKFYTRNELIELLREEKSIEHVKKIWLDLVKKEAIEVFERKQVKSNKNDIALFIGRFQPLHLGHVHVIENILKVFKQIKIGIGSSQLSHVKNDPFSFEERKQFISVTLEKRNIKPERYEVLKIEDIYNAKKWVDHVVSIMGNFNVLFSNSDWVRQLFTDKGYVLGKKLILLKKKYNASNIRNLIFLNDNAWKSLVPREVEILLKKFEGIERIKSLFKEEEINEE